MNVEIERRFLILNLPECVAGEVICQGYLAVSAEGDVRLRRVQGVHTLCVKQGSGLSRQEVEIVLEQADFDRLWPLTQAARIAKIRHTLAPLAGSVATCIDRYSAPARFDLLEVEFASEAHAQAFQPPDWCGEDVTDIATPGRIHELLAIVAPGQG
jgi:adenylate cyclase